MKKLLFSFAALAAVVACEQNGLEPGQSGTERELTIVANALTKTTLASDNKVLWNEDDKISVFFSNQDDTKNLVSEFTNTETENKASAVFRGLVSDNATATEGVYAVYPSTAMASDGRVSFTLAAAQQITAGSFPSGMNLSSAKINYSALMNQTSASADFLNAFSIIRFSVPANVKQVVITGTEPLVGSANFEFNTEGRLVVSSFVESGSKSITLTPSEETFTTGEGVIYNVLVYPGSHSSLSVELTDSDNCKHANTVTPENPYVFNAASYYTFNFSPEFTKDFTFTVASESAKEFTNGEKIKVVFGEYTKSDYYLTELIEKDGKFTGKLPHGVTYTSGYALYLDEEKYNTFNPTSWLFDYVLPSTTCGLNGLHYSAVFDLQDPVLKFNSIEGAFAKIKFTIPSGVVKTVVSAACGLRGHGMITVHSDGTMYVSSLNERNDLVITNQTGAIEAYVFTSDQSQTLTFTFTDGTGSTVTQNYTGVSLQRGKTVEINLNQDIDFSKNGNFTHEGFVSGGNAIEF